MSQKSIILVVGIFVVIIAGMFIFANLKQRELSDKSLPPPVATSSDPYADIVHVDAKHYYIDGVHTLVGVVALPTRCDLLDTSALVMESFPEQVRVEFNVINTAESCEKVVTEQRFQVSATASAEATFRGYIMGREIELNLIPAAAGETPEEFELFLKG